MSEPEQLGDAAREFFARVSPESLAQADRLGPALRPERESAEEHATRLALQAANRTARWLRRCPVMYREATIEQAHWDLWQFEAAAQARVWICDDDYLTLVLFGPNGTGKTHLAYAAGHALHAMGQTVEAWTGRDLLQQLRPGGEQGVEAHVLGCDVLIIDDLGATKDTDWAQQEMSSLLDHRVGQNRRQVVTTNLTWPELVESYGGRFADRLGYRMQVVRMLGESRRRNSW